MDHESVSALITLGLFGVSGAIPFVVAARRLDRMTRAAWASIAIGSLAILVLLYTTLAAVEVLESLGGFTCFAEPMVGMLGVDGDPEFCVERSREIVRDRALLSLAVSALQVAALLWFTRTAAKADPAEPKIPKRHSV